MESVQVVDCASRQRLISVFTLSRGRTLCTTTSGKRGVQVILFGGVGEDGGDLDEGGFKPMIKFVTLLIARD